METQTIRDKKDRKTSSLAHVIGQYLKQKPASCLVVGCGSGEEAGFLARHFGSDTIGIDISADAFDRSRSAPARLEVMGGQDLKFPANSFDLVYSFHAIEHIPDPQLALREMSRVLKPGGLFVIGTPNKSRLVGYVGSATTFRNKIRWNLQDWIKRMRGKWRNPIAHAGFKESSF